MENYLILAGIFWMLYAFTPKVEEDAYKVIHIMKRKRHFITKPKHHERFKHLRR